MGTKIVRWQIYSLTSVEFLTEDIWVPEERDEMRKFPPSDIGCCVMAPIALNKNEWDLKN